MSEGGFAVPTRLVAREHPRSDGNEQRRQRLDIKAVAEQLQHEGWTGFSLFRRYLRDHPQERRRLAQMARTLPWSTRADFATRRVRFAFLSSFSTGNVTDALWVASLDRGLIPELYHAPFNQLSLTIRDTLGPLYASPPDIAVVAVNPVDRGLTLERLSSADFQPTVDRFLDELLEDATLLHERSQALVLIHNFLAPETRPAGVMDWRRQPGASEAYARMNLALVERCRALPWVQVVDVNALRNLAGVSWATLHQPRFMGSYALPEALLPPLSHEYAAVAAAAKGFTKKCLVMDLDGTLWGGVVGEDGVANVQIGGGYPGNIYQELQRAILRLHERGVLLVINSKNNEADAWQPFIQRPEMLLRKDHLSAWRINWQDKVTNLHHLAQELNIGLDSMVVLDDNPTERAWIETRLPEVYVLPAQDPLEMLRALSTTSLFDALEVTAEDQLRAKSYAAAAQRRTLQSASTNLEEFLAQLHIEVSVRRPSQGQLSRVAQLTQRTNQFNLTTHRYTHEQIQALWASPDVSVLCCEVRDKFADEGLVGVAVLRKAPETWLIDTFLLSCRVLGRGVERAFLWAVCQQAYAAGARQVYGDYVPSAKNAQTADFYQAAGGTLVSEEPTETRWALTLPAASTMAPAWITLNFTEEP